MEVHFTAEQKAALRLLEEANFRVGVREEIAQPDRGKFIEQEEMDGRFEELLRL
jgi:hypothetical protein